MSRNSLLAKSHYIVSKDKMPQKRISPRMIYIKGIQSHIPSECPECSHDLVIDDEQIFCPHCGLVTQDSSEFVSGMKYHLPHGLRLG